MTAIGRSKVKIWVVPASTAASALVTTTPYTTSNSLGYITGEIKSYNKSGGEQDVESDVVFGGYVDKEKPATQFQVEFDIVPSFEKAIYWEEMMYGYTDVCYNSAAAKPADRAVFIEADDGTNPQAWGFNNCNVSVLDMEHNADDNMTKKMTLKFSPTDSAGIANFIFNSKLKSTSFTGVESLPTWANVDGA